MRALVAATLLSACAAPRLAPTHLGPAYPAHQDEDLSVTLRQIADAYWELMLRTYPEFATELGDHRYDDRLEERGPAAREKWRAEIAALREKLGRLSREGLPPQDRVTHEFLELRLGEHLEALEHGFFYWDVDQMYGPQVRFADLALKFHPRKSAKDWENLAARYRAFKTYMEAYIADLREGVRRGYACARVVVQRVAAMLDEVLALPAEETPYGKAIDGAPPKQLGALDSALREAVLPALDALRDVLKNELLPIARPDDRPGISHAPGGEAAYRFLMRWHTSTPLSPRELHELGLREVESNQREMLAIARARGHQGDLRSFMEAQRADAKNFFQREDELLEFMRAALRRADEKLPAAFGRMPRMRYEVQRMPEYQEKNAPAAYYYRPDEQGTRPGVFYANLYRVTTRPKYNLETLAYHEAVPGHHTQIATGMEIEGLPAFRRNGDATAYIEGWAHYAERLSHELGLFSEDLQVFGMWSGQVWRAARLVVDTGLHALGWTREHAIEYMMGVSALPRNEVEIEVDRYIVMPGQALAYKVGHLTIAELREKARAALGPRFSLPAYHDLVLGMGAVPLSLLRAEVQRWVEGQGAKWP
jgi:uncharacterized protein (DUF885 family)